MLKEENIKISNYTMKEFHDNLILVLLEIDRICKKNNITYVFTGGTALGAVRHNDFIPWDDDADIGMTRRNYRKFLKACKKDLNCKYFSIDSLTNEKTWGRAYTKVRLLGTYYPESWNNAPNERQGIWVDIFAYDKCPKIFRVFNRKIGVFFERTKLYKNKANIDFKHPFTVKMFSWLPNLILKFLINISSTFWNFLPSKTVIDMSFDYKITKFNINIKTFLVTKEVVFRGYEFPVPYNVEEMLTKKYGDWSKIPSYTQPTHTENKLILLGEDSINEIKKTFN